MGQIGSVFTIIQSMYVTEKASREAAQRKYVFIVDRGANTIEIKKAVEKMYKVSVTKINSVIVKGKTKRIRWNQPGKTATWKKAIVTLKEGRTITVT